MKHLRAWQRYEIAARLKAGYSKKEIAEYLHVHPSTITREIQRNGYSCYRVYKAKIAQEHRWRCRKLPRRFKEDVREMVDELIKKDYSPEQIVGECRDLVSRWCPTRPFTSMSGGTKLTAETCTSICTTGEESTRNMVIQERNAGLFRTE